MEKEQKTDAWDSQQWSEQVFQSLDQHRQRARKFLARQRERFERIEENLANQIDEIERLNKQLEEAGQAAAEPATTADPAELEQLRYERDVLLARIDDCDQQKDQTNLAADDEPMFELQRRFEMAIADLRAAKVENESLNEQLGKAHRTISSVEQPPDGWDWETQKKRLMEQLEGVDVSDPQQKQDKLSVEDAMQITEGVVKDKDREIADLKKQIGEFEGQSASEAVGASAIAEILDQDELIRAERDSLKRIQEEWREKLCQAEIDLSVERARVARERTELEQQLLSFEAQRAEHGISQEGEAHSKKSQKSSRGRWLAKLGLNGFDDE